MKKTLSIHNLHVSVEDKHVLQGVNLVIKPGEIHVLMGPNGSGKSTMAYALMGHPNYSVNKQAIRNKQKRSGIFVGTEDITELAPHKRALAGLYLAFQSPIAIPGVTVTNLLRTAYQAIHPTKKTRNVSENPALVRRWQSTSMTFAEFTKRLKSLSKQLDIDESFLSRAIHDGFSGGEKKKIEMLQALVLTPKFAVFDEIDTGLDVDALKTVASGVGTLKNEGTGVLVITHYQRILHYISPDFVHVLIGGRIVETGPARLAKKIEKEGYKRYKN